MELDTARTRPRPSHGRQAAVPRTWGPCVLKLRGCTPHWRDWAARLECQGYTIPVSEGVSGSIVAIHHDPERYLETDRFGRERFLERTYSSSEFLSSGGGHRRCLSGGLSNYEMRIALALTAWRKPSQAMPASAARGEPTHA